MSATPRNVVETLLPLAGLLAVTALALRLVFGDGGMLWIVVAVAAFSAVVGNPSIALLRARRARPLRAPELDAIVTALAARAGVAPPTLVWLPSAGLEAFTIGGRAPVVAVSEGLLRALSRREIVGVLAHEISHLAHRDLLLLAVARGAAGFGRFTARVGLLGALLALPFALSTGQGLPLLGLLMLAATPRALVALEMALSRAREFDADAGAVALTGDPSGLASALARVEWATRRGPLGWLTASVPGWLRSHPHTAERIARLRPAGTLR